MTEIRDIGMPSMEGEHRTQQPPSRGTAVMATLCISAALLTTANLAMAVYLYKAASDVAVLEKKFESLSAFEDRIKTRLDKVNNGVQAQFDRLNSDLQGRFGAIHQSTERLKEELSRPRVPAEVPAAAAAPDVVADYAPPVQPPSPLALAPEIGAAESDADETTQPAMPRRQVAKAAPRPSGAYQRLEAPDGKVYYRKVRPGE